MDVTSTFEPQVGKCSRGGDRETTGHTTRTVRSPLGRIASTVFTAFTA